MIEVVSFSQIKVDGVVAGDALSVYSNYPPRASELLEALVAYDAARVGEINDATAQARIKELESEIESLKSQLEQYNAPKIDLSAISAELIEGTFDEWLKESWQNSTVALTNAVALISALGANDIEKVRSSFYAIAAINPPTQEQLLEWQLVLDELDVPKEILSFVP